MNSYLHLESYYLRYNGYGVYAKLLYFLDVLKLSYDDKHIFKQLT